MPGGGGAAVLGVAARCLCDPNRGEQLGASGLPVYGPPRGSIYNGQARRSGQTVEQSFIARMREHHNDYPRTQE
jgi:hypothetical protein